jgi:hypothetical protein
VEFGKEDKFVGESKSSDDCSLPLIEGSSSEIEPERKKKIMDIFQEIKLSFNFRFKENTNSVKRDHLKNL